MFCSRPPGVGMRRRRGWVQAVANVRLTPDPADCSTFRNVAGQSGISNTYSMHGKFFGEMKKL